jgi:hypothetical protein
MVSKPLHRSRGYQVGMVPVPPYVFVVGWITAALKGWATRA